MDTYIFLSLNQFTINRHRINDHEMREIILKQKQTRSESELLPHCSI